MDRKTEVELFIIFVVKYAGIPGTFMIKGMLIRVNFELNWNVSLKVVLLYVLRLWRAGIVGMKNEQNALSKYPAFVHLKILTLDDCRKMWIKFWKHKFNSKGFRWGAFIRMTKDTSNKTLILSTIAKLFWDRRLHKNFWPSTAQHPLQDSERPKLILEQTFLNQADATRIKKKLSNRVPVEKCVILGDSAWPYFFQ